MVTYINYLNLPTKVAFGLVILFFILQVVGEILEFKGKAVPEVMKLRKYFARKKKEREAFKKVVDIVEDYEKTRKESCEMASTLSEVKAFLTEVGAHYSEDNIAKRDGWMKGVNEKFEDIYSKQAERDAMVIALNEKIDKNNEDTLSLLLDNKRNFILDFAEKAQDMNRIMSREQYRRYFKVYNEYEDLIVEHGLTNGEVDIANKITNESYEERLKKRAFFEDIHGYNI